MELQGLLLRREMPDAPAEGTAGARQEEEQDVSGPGYKQGRRGQGALSFRAELVDQGLLFGGRGCSTCKLPEV